MADTKEMGYLSIGEVLGLLLEDFPDVTISKIRFLESQGLISPERTSSGYRKFYEADVELLRVILTEQRSNYLPLRVIRDRLETGEIDPTGEHLRPNGEPADEPPSEHVEVPPASVAAHPAGQHAGSTPPAPEPASLDRSTASSGTPTHSNGATAPSDTSAREVSPREGAVANAPTDTATDAATGGEHSVAGESDETARSVPLLHGVLLDRGELCSMVGMTESELAQLEGFGIVVSRDGSAPPLYGDDAVEVARPACQFLRAGVDARHLRNWRTSAEREASLYEQLVTPRFRQRNPESHAAALTQLQRLDALGGALRAAMTKQALRRHFES